MKNYCGGRGKRPAIAKAATCGFIPGTIGGIPGRGKPAVGIGYGKFIGIRIAAGFGNIGRAG